MKADECEADDAFDCVEGDDEAALADPIAEPATTKHHDAGECVGWCDEALRGALGISQARIEDDGAEVGNGVGDGCGGAEDCLLLVSCKEI